MIDHVFSGFAPPDPANLADVNRDCIVDVFDLVYLIDYVFSSGAAPQFGCLP
jgi:hypothetical protein